MHEQIYSRDQYARVSAKHLLTAVIETLVKSYGSSVEVDYLIEDIHVSADTATPLALLANEVVTNSLKYAFPDGRGGKIAVTLTALSVRRACLVIRDDGVGFNRENMHSGMGSRLIKGVVAQLQGEFIYQLNGGTTFTAEMEIYRDGGPGLIRKWSCIRSDGVWRLVNRRSCRPRWNESALEPCNHLAVKQTSGFDLKF